MKKIRWEELIDNEKINTLIKNIRDLIENDEAKTEKLNELTELYHKSINAKDYPKAVEILESLKSFHETVSNEMLDDLK